VVDLKVFVLALDGLEYNLVAEWGLKGLQQTCFGKLTVPVNEKTGYPSSPEVWATFLAGKHVKAKFKKRFLDSKSLLIEQVLKTLSVLRKVVGKGFGLGRKLREFQRPPLLRFPEQIHNFLLNALRERMTAYNFPFINNDGISFDIVHKLQDGSPVEEVVDELWGLYGRRKSEIWDLEFGDDVDLILAFMHFPDILQHIIWEELREVHRLYEDLDVFVSALGEKHEEELFIVVSDHGFDFEKGVHSSYGFYSSNRPIKISRIEDFCRFLIEVVRGGELEG